MYRIGVDLGGTNISVGVVDEDFNIIGRGKTKTNSPRPAEEIFEDIAKCISMAADDAGISLDDVNVIGVGTPGSVNDETGYIDYSNNLRFDKVPAKQMLEELTGKPCFFANDASCAALGELYAGAGKGCKNLIAITLGTGVGSGIVIDGKVFRGANSAGGEIGHTVINVNGAECTCGRKGCWESYASATALIAQTKHAMKENPESKMWNCAGNDIESVNGRTAFDAMRMGDEAAKAVVDKYIYYVAVGIINVINVFQPDVLCVGGGICNEGETLLAPIRKYVVEERYSKYAQKQTEICKAQLGNDAGIIGAAMLGE
ncbi:MAG: ROK family protein [Oscillospiraceae bacterium]|nr:ROK family protein [Ruminococcus sp.]MDY6061783.1 ROK family protein [Oscillospiraceae bacterium]